MKKLSVMLISLGLACGVLNANETTISLSKTDPGTVAAKDDVISETPPLTSNVGSLIEIETRHTVGAATPVAVNPNEHNKFIPAEREIANLKDQGLPVPAHLYREVREHYGLPDFDLPLDRQGGDSWDVATVILSLPHSSTGTTVGYTDDYDEICPYSGSTSPDVVYSYTPIVDILVDITLCNGSDYDTKLYIYENAVTPGTPFACNDDTCPGYVSELTDLQLYSGNTYYIVIDGYSGASGNYVLDMTEVAPPAPLDCTNAIELICGQTIAGDNTTAPNTVFTYSCSSWNESGGELVYTLDLIDNYNSISAQLTNMSADLDVFILTDCDAATCVAYGNSTATLNYPNPGLYYVVVDGYNGASSAFDLTITCTEPCVVECPFGATIDPEPDCYDEYVDITNGGCDTDPAYFGTIACGETICGTAGDFVLNSVNSRDTDWYLFDITEPSSVTWSVEAEFPPYIRLVDVANCISPVTIASSTGSECEVLTVSSILYPGQYAAYVAPNVYSGISCAADFWGTLTCEPWSPPVGSSCFVPVVVTLPVELPYSDLAQTTCGMIDDYDQTGMGYYDGGEDIIYEVTVTEDVTVDITMDPGTSTWSGIGVFDGCPDVGTLLYSVTGSSATPRELEGVGLVAGTYYIMIDTWPSPECIPSFDLTIVDSACDIVCPGGGIDEGEDSCYDEYIDLYNGGCNADIPAFVGINSGDTICGTSGTFAVGGVETRDTDWFLFSLAEISEVVLTGAAEFDLMLALVSGVPDCDPEVVVSSATDGPCDVVTISTILAAGSYAAFVAPVNFSGVLCSSEYIATLTFTPWTPAEGDFCINPFLIESFPYTYVGNTTDNTDSYGNSSPDEWHQFTLASSALVTLELCGPETDYDTYLRLLGDDCVTQIAYDDDGPTCDEDTAPYSPSEVSIELEAGTYNVCIEGYSSNSGNYHLDIVLEEPCVVTCPPGGSDEGEEICHDEYVDIVNGGCNSTPYVFGAIGNGETICGTSGTYQVGGSNTRDTDWFLFDLAETSEVTLTGEAEFPLYLAIASGVPECPSSNVAYGYGQACEVMTIELILDAGTYAVFVAPDAYSGVLCGKPYYVSLNYNTWVPAVGETCENPLIAPCLPYQFFSTTSDNIDTYGNQSPDEWTRFTLDESAFVSISLCGDGTTYDSYLRLLEDDCTTEIASNDDFCGLQSQIDIGLESGSYLICVEGYSSSSGDYQLDIIVPTPAVTIEYSGGSAILTMSGGYGAGFFNIYKSTDPFTGFVLVDSIPNGSGEEIWMDSEVGSFFYQVTAACPSE